jgi:hypothetical protein
VATLRDIVVRSMLASGMAESEVLSRIQNLVTAGGDEQRQVLEQELSAEQEAKMTTLLHDERFITALLALDRYTHTLEGHHALTSSTNEAERKWAELSRRLNKIEAKKHLERAKASPVKNLPSLIREGQLVSSALMGDDWSGDDVQQMERVQSRMNSWSTDDPGVMDLKANLAIEDRGLCAWALGKWYANGLPVVQTSHTYAAALMATSMTREVSGEIRPPWSAFVIELPTALLSTVNSEKEDEELRYVIVDHRPPLVGHPELKERQIARWNVFAVGSNGVLLSTIWKEDLTSSDFDKREIHEWDMGLPFEEADERTLLLICRLVVGCCLTMSNPNDVGRSGTSGGGQKGHPHDPPKVMRFKLGEPLKLDCRPALREYVRTGKRSPNVRVLVRGHYKLQAHGTGRELRKVIWVKPYWRGPDEAPVLLRPHVIGE